MPLTISLQFPAGRYVAASWTNRDAVEWPPHPARLALGLVDALHRSGNPDDLRKALEQLCALDPPEIIIPVEELAPEMPMDGYFVPQNPAAAEHVIQHPRKGRSFPSICLDPDQPSLFFHWPQAEMENGELEALRQLVASLPRLGHSHSVVVADLSSEPPPAGELWHRLLPAPPDFPGTPDHALRVPYQDLLQAAETAFQADDRAKEMQQLMATTARRAKPGKPLKPQASSRGRHDPPARWHGYVKEAPQTAVETPWDSRVLILKRAGDRLDLPSTWQLTSSLHHALLDRWEGTHGTEAIPEWLSGHRPGKPGESTAPARSCHLAAFPLPNVGFEHSNGHLLGVGLALPKPADLGIDRATFRLQWRKALAALFGDNGKLELTPKGRPWTIELSPENSLDPRTALKPSRWVQPSTHWASVTPVILDRHPKPHFKKDPVRWADSCRAIIAEACERLGLPVPDTIEVSPHSPFKGVPPAFRFEAPVSRPGRPARFHIHATLSFSEPIRGPLLLGAGRYRGYGLFAPCAAPQSPAES